MEYCREIRGIHENEMGDANVHSVIVSTLFENKFVCYLDQIDYQHNWHVFPARSEGYFESRDRDKFCLRGNSIRW